MEKLIEQIRLKADACGDATKEQRARKGAYVDCIVMIKQALHKHGADCDHKALLWINSDWKYFCLDCGKTCVRDIGGIAANVGGI